ncbi:threonine/serine exporter [Pseudoflavonifractor sp. 524-17]|uniref:threonine/serine exporter family protein n=1 Tax=Pseudoflavonifractor sp. 524-17 TaxID=2304577 RepID=UPI001379FC0E|nr:threonine/serine exporter family protein [Pseudoflavonifractor sp. 524-17]NCE64160.1 threonine/serine exporter [Pseudoflavonifractor sp. 524-17]
MYSFYYFLPCLYAFVGCLAFAVTFNIHGQEVPISALGGAVGWLVYLLAAPFYPSEIVRYFFASVALSIYCEVMARIRKCPATSYLLISIFPLVPGAGIYYTMEYAVHSDMEHFLSRGMHTLGLSGALALGILLVSSVMRMWVVFRQGKRSK